MAVDSVVYSLLTPVKGEMQGMHFCGKGMSMPRTFHVRYSPP